MTTEIKAIKVRMELEMNQFKEGMERVRELLESVKNESGETKDKWAELEKSFSALGAGAAFSGLINTVKSLTEEANQLAFSMNGMSEVARTLGISVKETTGLAEELAKKGFISLSEASTAIQTALSSGLNLEQTRELIYATANAAAYNRDAHLGWGEAIGQVVSGIKSGNSGMIESAGITTNLSAMHERYATKIGITADRLTEGEKVQAAFTGVLENAAQFAGNAEEALDSYAGTQMIFNNTLEMARMELGEAFMPALQELMELVMPIIVRFTQWVESNKELVAGLSAAGIGIVGLIAGFTSLITILGAVRAAATALSISFGPIGWVVAALSLAGIGLAGYISASNVAAESVNKLAIAQGELNDKLSQSPTDRTVEDIKAMQADIEVLNEVLDRRSRLMDEYNQRMLDAEEGRGSIENTHALMNLVDEVKAVDKELKAMGYTATDAKFAVQEMNKAIDESGPAIREMRMEGLQEAAAKQNQITETKKLADQYESLRNKTGLTAEENGQLTSIVRQLTSTYPSLHAEMDAQGKLLITNEELIRNIIKAEEDSLRYTLTAEAAKRQSLIRTTEASITTAETHLAALTAVMDIEPQKAPWAEELTDNDLFIHNVNQNSVSKLVDKATTQLDSLKANLSQYKIELSAIENGTWVKLFDLPDISSNDEKGTDKGTGKGGKKLRAEEIAKQHYDAELNLLEKKRLLGTLTLQQEHDKLEKLAEVNKKYDDIWMDAESRRQRVAEQIAANAKELAEEQAREEEAAHRRSFDKSSEWIEKEKRLMTERGDSERDIVIMQLEAWTRIRSRYASDTEYYKQADRALYEARMALRRLDEAAAKDAVEAAKKEQSELTKSFLDQIDKRRKAELDALDEQRRKTEEHYDNLLRGIDESERGRERQSIEEEAEKYKFASSEKGQKRYKELQEQLRKMNIEDSKRALQEERDNKLAEFEKQKKDIESWYADLKIAAETFSGDIGPIYQLMEDNRLSAFRNTNKTLLAEADQFQKDLSAKYGAVVQAQSGPSPSELADIAQMEANSKAWHTEGKDQKQKLSDSNKELGEKLGAHYNSKEGKWYKDGVKLFHTGGIAGVSNFSAGNMLMPDEIAAILRAGEVILTPQQITDLVMKREAGEERIVHHNYYGPLIENNGDVRLEDQADINSYHREQDHLVRQMIARGERPV
ncbi:phage tail tape measure protein [Paenibacillus sp. 1011MAR3C5]|uniref:phage tail tape measure protein n=1 Tax=Paenibacillus sp. 1011MAR3C5 TaxID=1675787 RepID=UPI000E6B9659|nr:phage tail tape measure protein [Paenibacillus sp. 1011MAR3C5]RJE90672.1 phage tail tape measure protein [Paenibacillus sp. 1011MAR3C5]